MRAVVTGSTGLAGREVVAAARSRGGRSRGWAWSEATPCDLTGRYAVPAAVEAARPEVVVHYAAIADVDHCEREPAEAHRQNVGATAHVVEAAAVGAHLVHVSTD